jgi:FkbM family methyltransferase
MDKNIKRWMENNLNSDSIIIEAGTADGNDTLFFSSIFPKGFIYGFEPHEGLYNETIKKTKHLSNVSVEKIALGEKDGKSKFYVSDRLGNDWCSSSLLPPKDHLWFHKEITFKTSIDVDVINLDNWAKKNGVNKVDLIWFDIQGAESLVLRSSPEILSKTRYLYTEVSLIETYENVEKYNVMKDFLIQNGFEVVFEDLPWDDMGNVLFKNIYHVNTNIYVNGFWNGFVDKTDANNISFFEKLFSTTNKLSNFIITTDLDKADVLFESVFGNSLVGYKKWKYKIHYSGEPYTNKNSNYDLILYPKDDDGLFVNLPLFSCYINNNNFLDNLINKPKICKVPEKFCCFVVSNGSYKLRNNVFDRLSSYKKVDSLGKFNNNAGGVIKYDYWSPEFRKIIGEYKFILCFENTKINNYSTEKIVNPYLSGIIPIYWSSHSIKKLFNTESMIFLEDESEKSIQKIIDKVIELDKNDDKYLEYVNKPVFSNIDFWNDNFSIETVAKKIDNVLRN